MTELFYHPDLQTISHTNLIIYFKNLEAVHSIAINVVRSVRHNSHVSFNIVLLSPVAAYLTPEGWRVSYETNSFTLASQSEAYLAPRNKLVHISLLSHQDRHHSLDVK